MAEPAFQPELVVVQRPQVDEEWIERFAQAWHDASGDVIDGERPTWAELAADDELRWGTIDAVRATIVHVSGTTPAPSDVDVVRSVEEIDALPVGSVLLCNVQEVFWKATAAGGIWLAAGYTDTWTAAEVSEWAPLTVLHIGGEPS